MELIIASENDVVRAKRLVSWVDRPALDIVHITLHRLTTDERKLTALALRSYFNDCGCLWATGAFIAVLVASMTVSSWDSRTLLYESGASLVLSAVAAVVAKLAALAWSYWRLKALLARLQE